MIPYNLFAIALVSWFFKVRYQKYLELFSRTNLESSTRFVVVFLHFLYFGISAHRFSRNFNSCRVNISRILIIKLRKKIHLQRSFKRKIIVEDLSVMNEQITVTMNIIQRKSSKLEVILPFLKKGVLLLDICCVHILAKSFSFRLYVFCPYRGLHDSCLKENIVSVNLGNGCFRWWKWNI